MNKKLFFFRATVTYKIDKQMPQRKFVKVNTRWWQIFKYNYEEITEMVPVQVNGTMDVSGVVEPKFEHLPDDIDIFTRAFNEAEKIFRYKFPPDTNIEPNILITHFTRVI